MADHATPAEEPTEPVGPETQGVVEEAPLWLGESGQGLVEYGLAIFITVLIIIAIMLLVGPRIGSIFSRITQLG